MPIYTYNNLLYVCNIHTTGCYAKRTKHVRSESLLLRKHK